MSRKYVVENVKRKHIGGFRINVSREFEPVEHCILLQKETDYLKTLNLNV
jgi:hypothetical protein